MSAQTTNPQKILWEPFGYTSDLFVTSLTQGPLFSTPSTLCSALGGIGQGTGKACPSREGASNYCVPANQPCILPDGSENLYSFEGYIPALETCTHWPIKSAPPRFVKGKAAFDYVARKCSCFDYNYRPAPYLYPNLDTGYCYDPPRLQVEIDRDTYKPSEADKPINLNAYVLLADERMKGVDINIKVFSSDGEAGVVSPSSGQTNENGFFLATYKFPQFDKKKTDKLVITCDICTGDFGTTTATIKMSPTLVGFFNGVWNTDYQAQEGLTALKKATNQVKGNKSLKYESFYNQTGCGKTGSSCLQDVAEVFIQRERELDGALSQRWEFFWEMLSGNYTAPTSLTGSLLALLGKPASAFAELLDSTFNLMLAQIASGYSRMLSNPPTAADISGHVARLQAFADDDYTMVLIAHSQGNLFVNAAYDQIHNTRPQTPTKVVHIAPASPTLRGEHELADIDLVINGLRLFGVSSVAPVNLTLPFSKNDASGHTLVGTYLDGARAGLARTKAMIKNALDSL